MAFGWSNGTLWLEIWWGSVSNVVCLEENLESKNWRTKPTDRALDGPPFTNCGVDMLGPFFIKEEKAKKIWSTFYLFSK